MYSVHGRVIVDNIYEFNHSSSHELHRLMQDSCVKRERDVRKVQEVRQLTDSNYWHSYKHSLVLKKKKASVLSLSLSPSCIYGLKVTSHFRVGEC